MTGTPRLAFTAALLALTTICLAGLPALAAETWTLESGFSPTTNPNGVWSYGYQNTLGGALVLHNSTVPNTGIMTWCTDSNPDYKGCVNGNTTGSPVDISGMYWQPYGMTFHPGPQDQKAIIRWTAPYAASVYVTASFWGANYGSGASTDVHVLHNNTELFTGQISGYGGGGHNWFGSSPTQYYGGSITVAQGDTIDFACGYGNGTYYSDLTGVSGYITDTPPGPANVVINEIQSANGSTIDDEDGDSSDWIELHNAGGQSLDLNGYGLSDDPATPFKWTFPTYHIQPGQFLIVFASDKDRKSGPYFHTNYGIKSSGETISLTAPDGTLISRIPPVYIPQDMSYGRKPDASEDLRFFATATPGRPNSSQGYLGTLPMPTCNRVRGFYNTAFNLSLTTTEPDVTIRYTTDGSAPTESSTAYTAPIAIQAGAAGQIFKTTVVRARIFKTDYMPSPIMTNTYFVGPSSSARYNLPIVSLATGNASLFDSATGIYTNWNQEGDAWERPAHLEFFEPAGTDGFYCDIGLRLHGGWTKCLPQKSFRLYADHQGGPGSFNYRVFPDSDITDYNRLILRNWASDNEWVRYYWYSSIGPTYSLIRDALAQSLVESLDADTQNYRPAILFVDGQYWGLFALMEREDKEWVNDHHPEVDKDQLDMIQQQPGWIEVDEGDANAFNSLLAFLQTNDLIVPANYDTAKAQIDIGNVLTQNLANIYFGNTDWPGNNLRYWRPRTADGKWRWPFFDVDCAFGLLVDYTHPTLSYASMRGGSLVNPDHVCLWLSSLLRNREARDEFINRMADMLNTVFKPSTVIAKVDSMQAEMSPYIAEHFARWNNAGNQSQWNTNIQTIRTFANQRPAYVRNDFVNFFRLSGTSSLTLASSTPGGGGISISTIQIPSASLPWQGTYFNDVPIKLTAVPAAGYRFVRWNGAGLGSQNPATVVLSGDTTVTAVFEVSQ